MSAERYPRDPAWQHAEAFCLMPYQCETCKRFELIWNSRDGVTPFGVGCPNCNPKRLGGGGMMMHVAWPADLPLPTLTVEQLPSGARYFAGPAGEPRLEVRT